MRVSTLLWTGLGLAAAYGAFKLLNLKKIAQQANIQLMGVEFSNLNPFNAGIKVKIRVNNPVANAVKLNSVTGDVILGGEAVGKINYLTPTTIGGSSSTDLVVPVDISTTSIISRALDLLKGNTKVSTSLNGSANFDFGSVPFNQTIVS